MSTLELEFFALPAAVRQHATPCRQDKNLVNVGRDPLLGAKPPPDDARKLVPEVRDPHWSPRYAASGPARMGPQPSAPESR